MSTSMTNSLTISQVKVKAVLSLNVS